VYVGGSRTAIGAGAVFAETHVEPSGLDRFDTLIGGLLNEGARGMDSGVAKVAHLQSGTEDAGRNPRRLPDWGMLAE
jgi:hypothetical protein